MISSEGGRNNGMRKSWGKQDGIGRLIHTIVVGRNRKFARGVEQESFVLRANGVAVAESKRGCWLGFPGLIWKVISSPTLSVTIKEGKVTMKSCPLANWDHP